MKKSFASAGFTFAEIVVVVCVLSILAAMATVAARAYIQFSHDSACDENKQLIEQACLMTQLKGVEETDLDKLCDDTHGKPYLRSKPTCPLGGEYKITCADGMFTVTCSQDGEHHKSK